MHKSFEHLSPGIGKGIHSVAHAVDQSFSVKGFLVHNLLQVSPHRILVLPVGHMGLNIIHHLRHFDIGAAMFGSLQG